MYDFKDKVLKDQQMLTIVGIGFGFGFACQEFCKLSEEKEGFWL